MGLDPCRLELLQLHAPHCRQGLVALPPLVWVGTDGQRAGLAGEGIDHGVAIVGVEIPEHPLQQRDEFRGRFHPPDDTASAVEGRYRVSSADVPRQAAQSG